MESIQRAVTYVLLSSLLIRLPWWTVLNLTPAQRPRRSWTIQKCLYVKFLRFLLSSKGRDRMKHIRVLPTHLALQLDKGVEGVYVDGVPELLAGKVKEWAAKANVEATRIPGYWIHKKGENIIMGQKPYENEKVAYFLHGGAYMHLSAHPNQATSAIPRGLLRFCPSIKRSFAIEYRLSSIPPEPTAGQFPAALIDAIAGYN
ncbi:hypothetical protein EW145_g7807, partial [Phellinidium pouzarii]